MSPPNTPHFTLPNSYEPMFDEGCWDLTIDQSLLIAQAVHSVDRLGSFDDELDWARVVDILQKYAEESKLEIKNLVMRDPMACRSAYNELCRRYLEQEDGPSHSRSALALARKLYEVRINNISAALLAEEQRSKTLAFEIEEIERGTWDDKLGDPEQLNEILKTLGQSELEHIDIGLSTEALPPEDVVREDHRSRSTSPLNREGSDDSHPPKESNTEPARRSATKSSTPKAFLQVPVTRKRKTRSDSLSSVKSDSSTASKKKKVQPASPKRSSPKKASPKHPSRSPTAKPTSPIKQPDNLLSPSNQSPDMDDEIILQGLTSGRRSPSASTKPSKSQIPRPPPSAPVRELRARKTPSDSRRLVIGRGSPTSPRAEDHIPQTVARQADHPEPESKPHLTQQSVLRHTQPETENQTTEAETNSLRLEAISKPEKGGKKKADDDALSVSHSPTSIKKGHTEVDHPVDATQIDTPSSVSFPAGVTEGTSSAQQTPISLNIPMPQPDTHNSKTVASSSTVSDPTSFRRRLIKTHASVQSNPISAFFREPVKEFEAPGYLHVVKRPMDLRTLAKKIRDGKVTTTEEYRRDLMLMLANAVMFNHESSEVVRHAKELLMECDRLLAIFEMGLRY